MSDASRIDLIEARNEILDRISGYAQGLDNHDRELFRSVFHDDAVLDLRPRNGCLRGIEEIMNAVEEWWADIPNMHHWMTNPLIEIDLAAGVATGSTAMQAFSTYRELGQIHTAGRYVDRYERAGDRWAIRERRFEVQFVAPVAGWAPIGGSETENDGDGGSIR